MTDLLAVWTDEHGCHPRGGCHGLGRKGHHTSAVPDSWVRTAARRGVAGSSFVGERGQSTCAHQHKNAHQHRTKGAARHAPDGQERPRSTLADGSLPSPRCPPLIPPTPAEIARLFHVRDQRADVIEHALHRSCFRPDAKPRPDAITSSDPQDPSFTVMLKRVSTSTSGVRMKVLVIGGGPAGSVTATGLAQAGLEVALVEGAEFPRYHIGESLTPSCRAVLEAVGVAKKLDENGFVIKHGGVFQWNSDTWVFDWAKQIGVRSWQVDRSQFDALLLQHARDNGVSVRTGVLAKSVEFDGARPAAVHCQPKDGDAYVIDDFDFLVDASGRHGLLSSRHFGDRQPLQNLRNIAIWGYWTGATMLPDTPIGGINIISSDEGWYWVIPLADGRISIGYVTTKDAFARGRVSGESLDDLYHRLVAASQTVGGLVADAEHVSTARTETDYSYIADRFCGPGFAIVGDAACFLDPLLSTGVHLALYSALTAAACIASIGRGEATEDEGLLFFEFAYRRAYTRLFALVSVMYERYLGKDGFFRTSDRLIGDDVEEHPIDGLSSTSFAEIIGGLSDLREVTDSSTRVLTDRLRDEALKVQLRALGDAAGASMPDFTSIRENPLRDAESAHFRLVTEPELGLERIGGQQS